jgi:hypothetical protein
MHRMPCPIFAVTASAPPLQSVAPAGSSDQLGLRPRLRRLPPSIPEGFALITGPQRGQSRTPTGRGLPSPWQALRASPPTPWKGLRPSPPLAAAVPLPNTS